MAKPGADLGYCLLINALSVEVTHLASRFEPPREIPPGLLTIHPQSSQSLPPINGEAPSLRRRAVLHKMLTVLTARWLFVGNCRAGCAREMNDVKAFEANFPAPLAEIRRGVVKRIAEFDEHV